MFDADAMSELRKLCRERCDHGIPLYRRLEDAFVAMIEQGVLPDQFRLPSDMVLAADLGISHVTLGKVFNELRKRGMVERSRSLGTFVRTSRSLPKSRTGRLVAMLLSDFNRDTFRPDNREFFMALDESLRQAGLEMLMLSAAGRKEQQQLQIREVIQNPACCGAIIFSLLDENDVKEVLKIKPLAWPLIFVDPNHDYEGNKQCDMIQYDGYGACCDIARRFLREGGRRFVVVSSERNLNHHTVMMRIRGLWQALAEYSTIPNPLEIVSYEEEIIDWSRLLDRAPNSLLLAITASNVTDLLAAAKRDRIDLKRLLPAIGFTLLNEHLSPIWDLPLFAFDPGVPAKQAVALLCKRLEGDQSAFRNIMLKGDFMPKDVHLM